MIILFDRQIFENLSYKNCVLENLDSIPNKICTWYLNHWTYDKKLFEECLFNMGIVFKRKVAVLLDERQCNSLVLLEIS